MVLLLKFPLGQASCTDTSVEYTILGFICPLPFPIFVFHPSNHAPNESIISAYTQPRTTPNPTTKPRPLLHLPYLHIHLRPQDRRIIPSMTTNSLGITLTPHPTERQSKTVRKLLLMYMEIISLPSRIRFTARLVVGLE